MVLEVCDVFAAFYHGAEGGVGGCGVYWGSWVGVAGYGVSAGCYLWVGSWVRGWIFDLSVSGCVYILFGLIWQLTQV